MPKAAHCLSCSIQLCFCVEHSRRKKEVLLSVLQSASHMCRLRVLVGPADSGPQQRDVKKEKEGAMITIMQDGMRVTAANRQAWIEICTCPLSLVCSPCSSYSALLMTMLPTAARHQVRCTMYVCTAVMHECLLCSVQCCTVLHRTVPCCAVLAWAGLGWAVMYCLTLLLSFRKTL